MCVENKLNMKTKERHLHLFKIQLLLQDIDAILILLGCEEGEKSSPFHEDLRELELEEQEQEQKVEQKVAHLASAMLEQHTDTELKHLTRN